MYMKGNPKEATLLINRGPTDHHILKQPTTFSPTNNTEAGAFNFTPFPPN